jgi:3-phosphoshikimate 1-carboxyvinyltransferase
VNPVVLPTGHGVLRGKIEVPTSKSLTNRALVASAVAGGGTIVSPLDCDDTRVLATALIGAGWTVAWGSEIEFGGRMAPKDPVRLDLADSGTGSRLILALLATSPGRFVVDGSPRLRQRPMGPLLHSLARVGAVLRANDGFLPVEIEGAVLEGGRVELEPQVSSQFVSALVMAGPLMRKGLDLQVSGPLPSAPYLDLTTDVLRAFEADFEVSDDRRRWQVRPAALRKTRFRVEGDWSAAAFFLSAVAVGGGEIEIGPLDPASRQGDRAVVRILADAGLDVDWSAHQLTVRGPLTAPITADLGQTPDLFPALAVAAACAPPGSRFTGLDHLKHKESDRLTVMKNNLERLGATISVENFELTVEKTVDGGAGEPRAVTAAGDHRIAMAMAVAALGAGRLELDDPDAVAKSFPTFWTQWRRLLGSGEHEGSIA